jgi:hypothetical protein
MIAAAMVVTIHHCQPTSTLKPTGMSRCYFGTGPSTIVRRGRPEWREAAAESNTTDAPLSCASQIGSPL